ncbi:hypothetical protein GCM10022248_65170 [Nonomuraea soli]
MHTQYAQLKGLCPFRAEGGGARLAGAAARCSCGLMPYTRLNAAPRALAERHALAQVDPVERDAHQARPRTST